VPPAASRLARNLRRFARLATVSLRLLAGPRALPVGSARTDLDLGGPNGRFSGGLELIHSAAAF
jgi:hypothetical protein